MKFSENISNICAALCKFQGIVNNPKKDSVNPHFRSRYADLDTIITTIRPALKECGLSFIQNPTNDEYGNVGVYTILLHESGEYIQFNPIFIPVEKKGPHQIGAALTYARRYSLGAALGIATDEDDDANSAQPTEGTGGRFQRTGQPKKGTKPQPSQPVARAQEEQPESKPEEQSKQQGEADQSAPSKEELLNGMKQAIENIKEHVPTREEIQANLEQRKKKGRQEVHKMACVLKGLTKEESRAIIKAETGKGELKELTLEELERMYKFFKQTPAAELKEVAQAYLIAQEDTEAIKALEKEIEQILGETA